MSTFTCLQIAEIEPGIVLLTLDMPDSAANVLTQTLFAELDAAMEQLAARNDINGVILFSAKPKIFIAGADLKSISQTLDWSDEQIIKFCEQGRAVMARFSRCPFVTVAAIHGACVGGGLELTLWCDCRIASQDRRTQLGLPEVKLGLVPGWAGTARLPRLIGFAAAAELIVSGRLVSSSEARELKLIDQLVPQSELLTAARQMVRRVKTSQSFVHNRRTIMGPSLHLDDLESTVNRLGRQIIDNHEIFPFAPTVVLEHLARTARQDQSAAWKSESLAMAQVYGSPANRGLLNHFWLVDRNKKQPGLVDLKLPKKNIQTIGIVGAGLMGRAVAKNCLQRSVSVLIYDANSECADAVARELSATLDRSAQQSITAVTDYRAFENADLVIESVVETLDVKTSVLSKIEAAVSLDTILATNTSAIPIGKLAAALEHPQRFCGIHFCHPELMSLVEVVCGNTTSETTIASAVEFVRHVGKMAIAMNDGAGFVVNRLLAAMLDQSFRILSRGTSIEQIDQALREFGFLGGPFQIIDVIGADTCLYAGRTMWESGLRCVTVSPILPRMVKLNRLGRKTGVGFYRYPDPRGEGEWDAELPSILASYQRKDEARQRGVEIVVPPESQTLDRQEIATQIVSVMVLEATRILHEEIVADFRDIDLCAIHGFSFPQHRGGILYWADTVGLATVNQTLFRIAKEETKLEPSEMLKAMRFEKRKFYQ